MGFQKFNVTMRTFTNDLHGYSDLYAMAFNVEELLKELTFRSSRSSGSGGQNVNKVETRVEAILNLNECKALTMEQKAIIRKRLKNRIDASGNLAVGSSTSRYQHQNKKIATKRLIDLLKTALKRKKIRKKTGIPTAVKEKRLKEKKHRSDIKSNRKYRPDS